MKKKNIRLFAFLLALVLTAGFVFPTVAAAAAEPLEEDSTIMPYLPNESSDDEIPAPYKEAKDPAQLQRELEDLAYEITEMRGESVKHFRLADGTYQAVFYGEPVHRLDEAGQWQEIDNSLAERSGMLATKDSRVKFAKKTTGSGEIYTLHDGNYKITVGLIDAEKKVSGIVTDMSSSEEGMSNLQKMTNIENLSSTVIYQDVWQGVDVEYIVTSNHMKENVIVKKAADSYSYEFTLGLNGLTAKLENGSILLCDSKTEEAVYHIPAPYMYDAEGALSYDVDYTLTNTGNGKYQFTLTADTEWINAPERVFPVVIDPSLLDIGQTEDTYVTSANPTQTNRLAHELLVSSTEETYYRFATPTLPEGINITSATVKFPYYFSSSNNTYVTVNLYQITSDWSESYVKWNTKPSVSSACLDTADLYANGAISTAPQYATFSATNYVRSWYTGTANYGFALKRAGGNASKVFFVSKEKMQMFAQLTINYTGTHFAEGVYAIKRSDANYYVESSFPDLLEEIGDVLQDTTSYTAPPLTTQTLEHLFKIIYRPARNDYVIRSMLDSSLVIYARRDLNAPVAGYRSESDDRMPGSCTWNIEYTNGYYYISKTYGSTKYYMRSASTANGSALTLTTNVNDSGTKWSFHRYEGNVYEDIELRNFDASLDLGDTFTYNAYMRSTRIGHNGPVNYYIKDTDGSETTKATIDANTGLLTTLQYGKIKLQLTYPGAPWIWIHYISIGGTFVDEVPTNLGSNDNHKCIPCAITNVAAFWCIKEGLTQFACATAAEQEVAATNVHAAMVAAGGYGRNDLIQNGFNCFSHTEGGVTYTLQSTNYWSWQEGFGWDLLVSEINAGRPVMLGFTKYINGPHSTVCVGYVVENGTPYVFLSDAHESHYVRQEFNLTYNDFMATVSLVAN